MGFIIGRNVALEYRWSEGHDERLPELAAELVRRQVAVIAAVGGNNSAFAAKATTTDIPIVFTSGADPIRVGLVISLNRPGGNVTGVSWFGSESLSKRMGILGELVPNIKLAVLLVNTNMPEVAGQPDEAQARARLAAAGRRNTQRKRHRCGICRCETTTHGCHHRRCRSVLSHPPRPTRRAGRPSCDARRST
jgi:putative ABC transport system substrate-binding protein